MFKLQYYLLILTFSRVYKNQKSNIKIMGGGGGGANELLVMFYKLFQLTQTHWIRNPCFLLVIYGKCMLGKYCNDY